MRKGKGKFQEARYTGKWREGHRNGREGEKRHEYMKFGIVPSPVSTHQGHRPMEPRQGASMGVRAGYLGPPAEVRAKMAKKMT